MAEGQFSVFAFFPDESYLLEAEWVDEETAVKTAARLVDTIGARIGATRRVIITDAFDLTVFQWEFGKGVTFPPRTQ